MPSETVFRSYTDAYRLKALKSVKCGQVYRDGEPLPELVPAEVVIAQPTPESINATIRADFEKYVAMAHSCIEIAASMAAQFDEDQEADLRKIADQIEGELLHG